MATALSESNNPRETIASISEARNAPIKNDNRCSAELPLPCSNNLTQKRARANPERRCSRIPASSQVRSIIVGRVGGTELARMVCVCAAWINSPVIEVTLDSMRAS